MSSSIDIPSVRATPKSSASSRFSSLYSSPLSVSPSQLEKRAMERARRPSLLGSAISHQETTHVNIGSPDCPRLISYLSSGQGFYWNPEIFLPSYLDCDYIPLEHRREPVHEVHVTDEEALAMLPQ